MSSPGVVATALVVAATLALAAPLGGFLAAVLEGRRTPLSLVTGPLERAIWRITRIRPDEEQSAKDYVLALLAFHGVGLAAVYLIQRLQFALPLDPRQLPAVGPGTAFNTAISFVTNTNWQSYAGESTMTPLTQMLALTVQNFVSAGSGIAVMAALVRGFARHSSETVGNFWADLVRTTVHVLLPLSVALALALVSQGVVQTFEGEARVRLLEPRPAADGDARTEQVIPLGPVASQVAIKQLGTNGGGYFNANSSHPLENPTPLSNALEIVAILLLPAACVVAFGRMVGDPRQGRAILAAMLVLFVAFLALVLVSERAPNPALAALGVDASPGVGHVEGKEVRFGIAASALWATATTAASNGSVNAMHDSFSPLGGLGAMVLIQLGEVVFAGGGSGLYGMLVFALVTVFMAGLMVGRTPEYLGKKVEAFEMKMVSLAVLLPPAAVLLGTALAVSLPIGLASLSNPGAHGFSQVLYAFSSAANNNGSAFAGLGANTDFYNTWLGLAMLVGRFGVIVPVLAMAGSLAAKKRVAAGSGTLPTHTPLFVAMLVAVVLVVGALTFVPALALGPVVEHLQSAAAGAR